MCFRFVLEVFLVFSRFNYSPRLNFSGLAFSGIGHFSLVCVLAGQFTQFKNLGPRAHISNYQIVYFLLCILFCIQILKRKSKPNPKIFFISLSLFSSLCKRINAPADSRNGTNFMFGTRELRNKDFSSF